MTNKLIENIPARAIQIISTREKRKGSSFAARVRTLIIQDAGLNEASLPPEFSAYQRAIDDGCGIQIVLAIDGLIKKQWLESKTDAFYTGTGNPEWIDQPVKVLRGLGFTRLRGRSLEHQEDQYYQITDDYEEGEE